MKRFEFQKGNVWQSMKVKILSANIKRKYSVICMVILKRKFLYKGICVLRRN